MFRKTLETLYKRTKDYEVFFLQFNQIFQTECEKKGKSIKTHSHFYQEAE